MENKKLVISSSPHLRSPLSTQRIMLDVLVALLPAVIAGIALFGWRAALVIAVTTAAAVASEFIFNLIVKKKQTVSDLSATVTGVLLGLNLHAAVPLWQCAIGAAFAIIVVKSLFGGLGCNFANPAIAGRVMLVISFSGTVAGAVLPSDPTIVTTATPLANLSADAALPTLTEMLLGNYGGAIGETCSIALVIGFIYLVVRKIINFEVPLIFVGTVFVLSLIVENSFSTALYQILSGGLLLGAIFMATDYVTTPITRSGKMIFAFGCGLITYLVRVFGNYPEGVSFAILFMNILSPYIEAWTRPRALGGKY